MKIFIKRIACIAVFALLLQIPAIPFTMADDECAVTDATECDTENETESVSGSGQSEDVPMETATFSEDVDADNVVDVLAEDITGGNSSTDEALVNEAVDDVVESLEGESTDDVAEAIENIEEDIDSQIDELENDMDANPKLRAKIMKKIEHLKALTVKLRAKLITKHQKLAGKVKKAVNQPGVFEIRWGNLDAHQFRQKLLKNVQVIKAVRQKRAGDIKAITSEEKTAEGDNITYKGNISIDKGTLFIRNKLLFEENDAIISESEQKIEFTSMIFNHWDGLLIEYTPEINEDGTREQATITITLGDFTISGIAQDVLGRHDIGNSHQLEIKRTLNVISGVSGAVQDKLIQHKLAVQDHIKTVQEKVRLLHENRRNAGTAQELEDLADEIAEYNFEDQGASDIEDELSDVTENIGDGNDLTDEELEEEVGRLREKFNAAKNKSKALKFQKKMIPFKDTDDDQWFTDYVSKVKNRGIISGYKDASGNELGEFRPGNNITIAEILKIGLETAQKGKNESKKPNLASAMNHWAKAYVAKAEELGLDIVKGNPDLNRPATRGEVVRMMLEALGVEPDTISSTDFSDVTPGHVHAAFIQYAKDLGIVSGDAGKTTFRPDAPVNRAEAAKIANQIIELLLGE